MNLKKYYSAFNKNELLKQLTNLKRGCGAEVDSHGDCWHIHTYKPKYCNKCKRRIQIIEEMLK